MTTTALKDLAERTVVVYVVTFLGLLLATGFNLFDLSALKVAAGASLPAAIQVVYGYLATFVGDPKTAGLTDSRNV